MVAACQNPTCQKPLSYNFLLFNLLGFNAVRKLKLCGKCPVYIECPFKMFIVPVSICNFMLKEELQPITLYR